MMIYITLEPHTCEGINGEIDDKKFAGAHQLLLSLERLMNKQLESETDPISKPIVHLH